MSTKTKRRDFIKKVSAGVIGSGVALNAHAFGREQSNVVVPERKLIKYNPNPNVGLVKGSDRKTNMYDALKLIEEDIKKSIGDKQVVIKPNFTRVKKDEWLASTQVESVEAMLEILQPFYKKKVIIAEGCGGAEPIEEALENFDYLKLADKYNVDFYDLRNDPYSVVNLMDIDIQPMPIKTSNLLLSPETYVISASVMKTHGLAVVTLGLKNIVLAAPMNPGKGKNERGKLHTKPMMEDPRYFNYNSFMMSQYAYPDLVMIDGFIGMEGKGPLWGDPIEVGVAIASTDCIAADRVGTDVMGHDFDKVGHLVHCANAKMGEGDIAKINVLGDKIVGCRKYFRKTDDYDKIIRWN